MSARPAVSVIVPFLGGPEEARSLVEALSRLRLRPKDELVVADNGFGGGLATAAEGSPVRVVEAPLERSSYYARNVGAENAGAPWLLFLDADCRPAPGLLDSYFAEPLPERCAVVAGGVVADPEQDAFIARYARSRGHIGEAFHIERGPRPAGITANLLVLREAWESLGGFQEGIRSGEDVVFCWRAQEAGWDLAHRPQARVRHLHPERLRSMLRKTVRHAAGRFWVNRWYRGAYPRPRLLRAWARSLGGAVVWSVSGRLERAGFKLVDGLWASANAWGWYLGDNRSQRPVLPSVEAPEDRGLVLVADAFPARSETFVYNEARVLRERGWTMRAESSGRPARPERSVVRGFEIAYLGDEPPRAKLGAGLWLVARHPLRCARDLIERRRWTREEEVWPLAALAPAARRLARRGERHLHVHFAAGAALHALRLSRLLGLTYSVEAHAYDIYLSPRNLREKLERSAFATADCDYTVRYLRELVGPEHADRVHRIVMGVDAERFRRRNSYPGGRSVVAVGRYVEKKGFADLIAAAARLRDRGDPVQVTIAGDGPLRPALEEQVARLELEDVVRLPDVWGPAAIRDLLEGAAAFAMPAVIAADGDRDSMPVVVKEALAMEVPVVASDEVGIPEMVRPEWGRLAPPGDPGGLADALSELLALPDAERAAMGAAGRAFVIEHCDVGRETARLADLIRTTVGARRT